MSPLEPTAPTLSARRQRFVKEYLVDLNATQAAIRAGYSAQGAAQAGHRLLTDPAVSAAIQASHTAQLARVELDADTVLRALMSIGMLDIADLFDDRNCLKPIGDIPPQMRCAIAAIEVVELYEWVGEGDDRRRELTGYTKKVKFWDKKGALELLGKRLRLFTDRVEHGAEDSLAALIAQAYQRPRSASGGAD